ncbi:CotH kinase family protein [Cellvibrio sp. pealriver]|uniref:CotH kinase family protein n=1 Tax=Cellvibrio sp. pealriver TaxID=1622269 RepID=UPI0018CCD65F|nr:CotH kinase family protein [Cellvibrio sp. pealriver]
MKITYYFSLIFIVSTLLGCGGGGGSSTKPTNNSSAVAAASSILATTSSALSSSSSSVISAPSTSWAASSKPADFPVGVAEALPALNITTVNSAPIVSKETYLNGNFSLTDMDGAKVEGTLEIRGRGNSTWDWPKKPYRLKLTSSAQMLGMPSSRHWVLLANYADKPLMRNDIAFMFSRHAGMEYTTRNQYVELTLNGNYQGVYQLVEHIRVAKDRVNIPELKAADTDAEKITGGYLMEVDFRMHKDYCKGAAWDPVCVNGVNTARETTYCIDSSHGMNPFCVDTPETLLEADWAAQREYIGQYIIDTEAALFGNNFTDEQLGYAAYIDVDSAINYYLINELFKNPDGAVASFYLYKKRNGKLFFGPVWDFDLAMGNAGYDNVDKVDGWHIRPSPWFNRLFQDPAFQAKVTARWNTLKAEGKLDYIFQYAEARAAWLDKVQAKNYTIWSITDFASWILHGTHGGTGSYEAESKELIRWQRERYLWIDAQLNP